MARLFADENFHFHVVLGLRQLGHDVLAAKEVGMANKKIPDFQVLVFAHSLNRAVLTHNHRDYIKLHKRNPRHSGIIVCTSDSDFLALAQRIHQTVITEEPLDNKLLRVNKPP